MVNSKIPLRGLYLINFLALLVGLAVLEGLGQREAMSSYLIGWALSAVNLILIWVIWQLVFAKKFIALVVSIIVLKYAILVYVIYKLSSQAWLNPLVLVAGVLSLVMAITIFSLTYKKLRREN